jgi:hypothetical protein
MDAATEPHVGKETLDPDALKILAKANSEIARARVIFGCRVLAFRRLDR